MASRAGASACPGFQLQPYVSGSKKITFSGPMTAPLIVPSSGNSPLPVGAVGVMKGALDRVPVPMSFLFTPPTYSQFQT